MKNPQTTIALPFLTHNISAIGGVEVYTKSVTAAFESNEICEKLSTQR